MAGGQHDRGPALAGRAHVASKTSLGALLSAGYRVASIIDVTDAEQKSIWPDESIEPYIMVTLQRSGSVAVCSLVMANWLSLSPKTLADTSRSAPMLSPDGVGQPSGSDFMA